MREERERETERERERDARESLYSKFAVVAGWPQSTRAESLHFFFFFLLTGILLMNKFCTCIYFHEDLFICNYHSNILSILPQLEPSKSKTS